jgi:hypothetical protein
MWCDIDFQVWKRGPPFSIRRFLVEDDKSTVYHIMQGAGARECIMKDIVRMSEWVKLPV